MRPKYKVCLLQNNEYEVIEIIKTEGARLTAYESEPDTIEEVKVFQGTLSDCEAYIRLKDSGYL
jgi:hypothetical protein